MLSSETTLLSSLESTTDGNSVVLGMVDGNLTVLTIADPKKPHMKQYLNELPSRYASQMWQFYYQGLSKSKFCNFQIVVQLILVLVGL